MLKLIREIRRNMSVMNIDGIRILAEVARDIVCNKKYRKADGELTPEQFDRQVKQVLDIVKRNEVCNV